MKTNFKDKFTSGVNFVKPLYKKVGLGKNKVNKKTFLAVHVGSTVKLVGDGKFTQVIDKDCTKTVLPGVCSNDNNSNIKMIALGSSLVGASANTIESNEVVETLQYDKTVQVNNVCVLEHRHKVPEDWLRVVPAVPLPGEGLCSIVFRCLCCQVGLLVFLLLWTGLWVFLLFCCEESFEENVSLDFQDKQNGIIISLATELRQITPVSPKWRQAIIRRIENERKLTEEAVANGARHDSGRYWTLPGTFLFTVYVMTALGFGAPVPHTVVGKIASLTYAAVAIPVHVYLMLNMSTFIMATIDEYRERKRCSDLDNTLPNTGILRRMHRDEHQNGDNNTDLKRKSRCRVFRQKLSRCTHYLCVGYGLPFVAVFYYSVGLIAFGFLREADVLHSVLFAMQFTTTGGLANVAGHVRVLYGIYVEGAYLLLSCMLAAMRRYNGAGMNRFTHKYRLFVSERGRCKWSA